jgi:hypothetical protein
MDFEAKVGRNQYLFGVAAGLTFIATILIGGRLWPGYTIYQAISELTSAAAPHRELIIGCFILFNLLLLLHGLIITTNFVQNHWLQLSGFAYQLAALAGLVMAFFPMDPRFSDPTIYGLVHRIMATIAIVSSVVIVLSSAIGFGQIPHLSQLARRSLLIGCLIAVTALGVWISALRFSLQFGTFQKISMGIFMLWLCWTSLVMRRLWTD